MSLADQLEALGAKYPEPWKIDKEPHDYDDGTTHFNHIRFTRAHMGEEVRVVVAQFVTPDLGELLCLLHNNLDTIVAALRRDS